MLSKVLRTSSDLQSQRGRSGRQTQTKQSPIWLVSGRSRSNGKNCPTEILSSAQGSHLDRGTWQPNPPRNAFGSLSERDQYLSDCNYHSEDCLTW